ncbi:hypothetical protein FRC06_003985 [Ceratobasidium sp. 370]|nr:hypothetical protein FRC06_003985 [Ceratobasidium sp. 370]
MSSTWKAAQANIVRNLSLAGTALIANQVVGAQEEDNSPIQRFQTSAARLSCGPDNVADIHEGFEDFEDFEELEGSMDFDKGFEDFDEGTEMNFDEFGAGFDDAFEPFDDFYEERDEFPLFDDPINIPKISSIPPVSQDVEELEGDEGDEEDRAADLVVDGILIALAERISAQRGP